MKRVALFCTLLCWSISYTLCLAQTPEEVKSKIESYLADLGKAHLFSGAVLVAKDGQPIVRKAYGLANRSHQVLNTVDTKFGIASIGKMITATAIMQLQEQGRLKLSDLVGQHLPDYPNTQVREQVSIHHLLSHSSGMGQFFNAEYFNTSKDQLQGIQDFLPLFVEDSLAFAPGSQYAYSNGGYLVLGLIIEAISGQSYEEYVQANIYQPLGMRHTAAYPLDAVIPNMATGYVRPAQRDGAWTNNLYHTMQGGPAGGSFSTVDDLFRFAEGIRNHQLLKEETTRLMTTGKIQGHNHPYAYGFEENIENGQRIIGHLGAFLGIKGEVQIHWNSGYTIIILSNMTNTGYEDISHYIHLELVGTAEEKGIYEETQRLIRMLKLKDSELAKKYIKAGGIKTLSATLIEIKGYEQMIENKLETGIAIFQLGTQFFPNDFGAHYNLAAAYRDAKQYNAARHSFERCLEINPQAGFVKRMLAELPD